MLELVGELSALSGSAIRDALANPGAPLAAAVRVIRESLRAAHVVRLAARGRPALAGRRRRRRGPGLVRLPGTFGVLGEALGAPGDRRRGGPGHAPLGHQPGRPRGRRARSPATPNPGASCCSSDARPKPLTDPERELIRVAATALGNIIRRPRRPPTSPTSSSEPTRCGASRATSAAGWTSTRSSIALVDHAAVLFSADRVAAFLFEEDGRRRMAASRGLSPVVDQRGHRGRGQHPRQPRRSRLAGRCSRVHYADDPRVGNLRAAVIQEGFDTACVAPLLDADSAGGPRDPRRLPRRSPMPGPSDELDTMAALATQATVAIKAAAQLRPARDLGGAAPVDPGPGHAPQPADERQGDRRRDRHGAPPADRLPQRPRVPAVRRRPRAGGDAGPGRRVPRRDARAAQDQVRRRDHRLGRRAPDRRSASTTPPRTSRAPRRSPGRRTTSTSRCSSPRCCSRTRSSASSSSRSSGLRQFRGDDLRLLEIYASFAAQAMANADATERLREQSAALEQKVRGQRELLEITESILTTLDPPVLLGTIADRLGELIGSDNVAIELRRPGARAC